MRNRKLLFLVLFVLINVIIITAVIGADVTYVEEFTTSNYSSNPSTNLSQYQPANWDTSSGKLLPQQGITWINEDDLNCGASAVYDGTSTHTTVQIEIEIDSLDNIHIIWQDNSSGTVNIFYAYYNGATWQGLDSSDGQPAYDNVSNLGGQDGYMDLDVDSNNRPHIIWYNSITGGQVYYTRWDGSAWNGWDAAGKDDLTSGVFIGSYPDMVLYNNLPKIVFTGKHVFGATWDETWYREVSGGNWSTLSQADTMANITKHYNLGGTISSNIAPKIYLDGNGRPNVIWTENDGTNYDSAYSRWNGSAWVKADGTAGYDLGFGTGFNCTTGECSAEIGGFLDSNDYINILWRDDDDASGYPDLFFVKWNGTAWAKSDGTAGYDQLLNDNDCTVSRLK